MHLRWKPNKLNGQKHPGSVTMRGHFPAKAVEVEGSFLPVRWRGAFSLSSASSPEATGVCTCPGGAVELHEGSGRDWGERRGGTTDEIRSGSACQLQVVVTSVIWTVMVIDIAAPLQGRCKAFPQNRNRWSQGRRMEPAGTGGVQMREVPL